MTQWDFQNKGNSGRTGKRSFVLEVPLRYLRLSVIYSVPYDRIPQRGYYYKTAVLWTFCRYVALCSLTTILVKVIMAA